MTILTLVCSQSTKNEVDRGGFISRFNMKLPHAIPVRGRCQLVEYTVLCQSGDDADFHKLLKIDVPWLDCSCTHILGCGSNPDSTHKELAVPNYDQRRHTSKNMLLTCLHKATLESPNDMKFVTNTTTIPSQFDIFIKSGLDGSDYTNVMHMVLKFSIEVAGLF
jgi:hypothetical protein